MIFPAAPAVPCADRPGEWRSTRRFPAPSGKPRVTWWRACPRLARLLRRLPAAAAVLSLVATLLLGGAAPAAALAKQVVNGLVFNDRLGAVAQQ